MKLVTVVAACAALAIPSFAVASAAKTENAPTGVLQKADDTAGTGAPKVLPPARPKVD